LATTPDLQVVSAGQRNARRLLRQVCFLYDFCQAGDVLGPILADELDWEYVFECGARHRVLGILEYGFRHLPASGLATVPEDVRRRLMAIALDAEVQTRGRLAFLRTLLTKLNEHGIPGMILKGFAVAALYPELRQRPSDDIDLLVRESDWPLVARLLPEIGMRPCRDRTIAPNLSSEHAVHLVGYVAYGEIQYTAPELDLLEVHFRVFNVGMPTDTEDAWERQRVVQVADMAIPTIGVEDAVLFHAVHANWHRFCRLIWLADLHRMLRSWAGRIQWDWLIRTARARRMGRALACALELAQQIGGPVQDVPPIAGIEPPGRRAGLRYRRRWAGHGAHDLDQVSNFSFDPLWYYLCETATWPERLRFLYRAACPPRACLGGEGYWSYWTRLAVDRFPWSSAIFGKRSLSDR